MYVDTSIDGRIFHFHLGSNPGVIGKVRYSAAKNRDYKDEYGQQNIWHRYDRENELIDQDPERDVVNITLDVNQKDEFDPDNDHFLFLTEELVQQETYSRGDQKIWIEDDGQYSGPLAKHVNDWDAIFEYATESTESSSDPVTNDSALSDQSTPTDTTGHISTSQRTQVQVSSTFTDQVYERYEHRCPLSGTERRELLTISHIIDRSERPELAEDVENVLLLDWTHHMAFDAGLWTFNGAGRIWVQPGFEPASDLLQASLVDQHGELIDALTLVGDEYIRQHNEQLDWWPLR